MCIFGYFSRFGFLFLNSFLIFETSFRKTILFEAKFLFFILEGMKSKLLNALLILTSLLGYLEWGGDNHAFLFQAEYEILTKLCTNPTSVMHPFTILPLVGQIILLITLFQKTPNKTLTYMSICGLSLLLLFMFIIGLISLNYKIMGCTLPFIIVVIWTILHYRKAT